MAIYYFSRNQVMQYLSLAEALTLHHVSFFSVERNIHELRISLLNYIRFMSCMLGLKLHLLIYLAIWGGKIQAKTS